MVAQQSLPVDIVLRAWESNGVKVVEHPLQAGSPLPVRKAFQSVLSSRVS